MHLLEYLLVRVLCAFLGGLPASWGRTAGRALGRSLGTLLRGRTRRALDNMALALPDSTEEQRRAWVGEFWDNLGCAAWEFARLTRMSKEEYFARVRVEGLERLREAHRRGKGVILFTAHYTNWEYDLPFIPYNGLPLAAIARRMKNSRVNDFITRVRARSGARVFMHRQAVRESIRWLRQGNVVGLLIDQRITDGGVLTPFLGRPAHTTTMPALLALRLGSPILPIHCWREGEGIVVRVSPEVDVGGLPAGEAGVAELTGRLNRIVEGWVRERPPMWLWIHNRWKP